MAKELRVDLLGSPKIMLDDRPVTGFVSSKALALVFYLAATGGAHTRDALANSRVTRSLTAEERQQYLHVEVYPTESSR